VTSAAFDVTPAVLKNIDTLALDYLIAIGGDDTLSYASELDRKGIKVIAVPKTMDNDVRNTEYCIGFSTAITRAMDAIDRQRTTVGSHEHIGLFRVFGRDAGYTALYTAYVTGLRCCIPEYKVDLAHLIDLLINDKRENPSNYSLAVLSEGAEWQGYTLKEYGEADAFGHRKKMSVAEDLREEIRRATGEEAVVSDLTYDLRSASPDFVDRLVAFTFAGMAMDALEESKSGLDDRDERRALRDGADSRFEPRSAQGGCCVDVRYRALLPATRPQDRSAVLPHATLVKLQAVVARLLARAVVHKLIRRRHRRERLPARQ